MGKGSGSKNSDKLQIVESDPRSFASVAESGVIQTEAEEKQRKAFIADGGQIKKGKNKKRNILIVVLVFLIMYIIAYKNLKPDEVESNTLIVEGKIEFNATLGKNYAWIGQKFDHFNQQKHTMWKQRLILDINTDLITEKTPIFLHIPPLVEAKDSLGPAYLKTICSSLNCAKIGIEPRYFGESLPMGQDSYLTNNLKFLTIQQIVEDVAYAIERIQSMKFFGISKANPWIICGQSLSGIIALLVRAKYPELTVGAYSSSPILPTTVAPKVSEKVYSHVISGGKKCRTVIQSLMRQLQETVYGSKKEGFLLQMGRTVALLPEEAMYLFAERVRRLNRNYFISLCSSLYEQSLI